MSTLRRSLWLTVTLALSASVALLLATFDWNWLRTPLERKLSERLQRHVVLGNIDVNLGLQPVIHLRNVVLGNAAWSSRQPMAQVREIEFSVTLDSLLSALTRRTPVVLPHMRLTGVDLLLERLPDGRANWRLGKVHDPDLRPPPAELRLLRIDDGRLTYRDGKLDIQAHALAHSRSDAKYPTVIGFAGRWRGTEFGGRAEAGSLLGFQRSSQPFDLKLDLRAGATVVRAEGQITNLASFERIDTDFFIAGPSLASLYPTLRLVLPASPPYRLQGRLTKEGNTYAYGGFHGRIGESDLSGDGEFVIDEPRPRLTATLRSKHLRLADLGPLVGIERRGSPPGSRSIKRSDAGRQGGTQGRHVHAAPEVDRLDTGMPAQGPDSPWILTGTPPVARSQRAPWPARWPDAGQGADTKRASRALPRQPVTGASRSAHAASQARARATRPSPTVSASGTPGRVLPDNDLDPKRLQAIDADVRVEVALLQLPIAALPVQQVRAWIRLDDRRLRIDPLQLQFAGGDVLGDLLLDGRHAPLRLEAAVDLRRLQLDRLLAPVGRQRSSGGRLGAQVRLTGSGSSIADIAAAVDGRVAMGMGGGRISHMALAAVSLNGGRALQLLLGGDRPVPIRCAGMALEFKHGLGEVSALVFDTERVRVDGDGTVDLRNERFDFTLKPRPKDPNLLSVRAPLRLHGRFSDADAQVDPRALVRGGAAVALGLINPLAALLPLVETGPGDDSDCRSVLAPVKEAAAQADNDSESTPR